MKHLVVFVVFFITFWIFDGRGGFFGASTLAIGECINGAHGSGDILKVIKRGSYSYKVINLNTNVTTIRSYSDGFTRTDCPEFLE